MRYFYLSLFFFCSMAEASFLEDVCLESLVDAPYTYGGTMALPVKYTDGVLAKKKYNNNTWVDEIHTMDGKLLATTKTGIHALIKFEDSIWALGAFELYEYGLEGQLLNTFIFETNSQASRARSMTLFRDFLLVSRGMGGVFAFDIKKKMVVWTKEYDQSLEGVPAGITTDGEAIFLAAAPLEKGDFTGILRIDPLSGNVIKKSAYNIMTSGVVVLNAKLHFFNSQLILNNGGWIHTIPRQKLDSGKSIRPNWISYIIPSSGEVNQHYMNLLGDFFIEKGQIVGCGMYLAKEGDEVVRKSRLFRVQL